MSLSNINWPTYQPTYAGAPIQAVASTLEKLDKRHWENLQKMNQIDVAFEDMQAHDVDRELLASIRDKTREELQALSQRPSLARATTDLNRIGTNLMKDVKLRGALENKMYIDAEKENIDNLYKAGKYSIQQRDKYLTELEQNYRGVQTDRFGMFEPYKREDRPFAFNFDEYRKSLTGLFKGDEINSTSKSIVDRIEYDDAGKPYRVKEEVTSGYRSTPGDDFEMYYRRQLEENPDAMAYLQERARMDGLDPETGARTLFNREVRNAREEFEHTTRIDHFVELERHSIQSSEEFMKNIIGFDVAVNTFLTDITSHRDAQDRISTLTESIDGILGNRGTLYQTLADGGVPDGDIQKIKATLTERLKADENITLGDFNDILGNDFRGMIQPLSNYLVALSNIRGDKRVVEKMLEDTFRGYLDEIGYEGSTLDYLDSIEPIQDQAHDNAVQAVNIQRAIASQPLGSSGFGSSTVTQSKPFEEFTEVELARYEEAVDAYMERHAPHLVHINRKLRDYAVPFTSAMRLHDFGTGDDATAMMERAKNILLPNIDSQSALQISYLDGRVVDATERDKYIMPNRDTEVYWVAGADGRIGIAFRAEAKDRNDRSIKSNWLVSYAFSDSMRTNLTSNGVILESDLNFMSMINQITKLGGSGEIPITVNGETMPGIGIRTLTKQPKDAPHVSAGGVFEMTLPDGKGGRIYRYPSNYFEAHDLYNAYMKKSGYYDPDVRPGDERIISRLPSDLSEDRDFTTNMARLADKYRIPESYLYAVMDFETGGSFSPSQKNAAGSSATGLIQFIESTARSLGTSTAELSQMSRGEQMRYVEMYFDRTGLNKLKTVTFEDLYMAILYPAAIGKPDNYKLFREGTKAYDQNKQLDSNNNGYVTKQDAASKARERLDKYQI